MSSTMPPAGPPSEPGSAEILDSSGGDQLAPRSSGRGGRKGLLVGGGVLALAVVGGGAWAATSFLATGAQPAEALPAGTLGYASIDLDPSGGQKIEALRTLNKFPGFEDEVGISPDADVRQKLVEEALSGTEGCEDVDWADDVEPWLGERAAVAAVPGPDGAPVPVGVVQVTDADAADAGLALLRDCGTGEVAEQDPSGGGPGAWVIEGDWAVIAETEEIARATVDAAGDATLADDADYQRWTGEAGDPGIITMYAAPGAGQALLDSGIAGDLPASAASQLADFEGLAATVRFADGSFELEGAGQTEETSALGESDVADRVADLPDDTAVALGLSLTENWFDQTLDQFAAGFGGGDAATLEGQLEQQSGLSLPEDAQTLTQGGLLLSVGPDLDPEAIANAADPSSVPVALELGGDTDAIQAVLAKIESLIGIDVLGSTVAGDTVVVGPSESYREQVAQGGDLAGTEKFRSVVTDPDSPAIFYLDVDAFDDVVESFGVDELTRNVEPLSAIGASSRVDGDVTHVTVRVGTD